MKSLIVLAYCWRRPQKFCEGVGLHKDLISEILKTDSDWAFILKVDALLESAAKQILREGLRFKILNKVMRNEILDDFVDSLPMNGRTSLLKLLDAACLPHSKASGRRLHSTLSAMEKKEAMTEGSSLP